MNPHPSHNVETAVNATLLARKVERQMTLLNEAKGAKQRFDWILTFSIGSWLIYGIFAAWISSKSESNQFQSQLSVMMIFLAIFNVYSFFQSHRLKAMDTRITALIELMEFKGMIGAGSDPIVGKKAGPSDAPTPAPEDSATPET